MLQTFLDTYIMVAPLYDFYEECWPILHSFCEYL